MKNRVALAVLLICALWFLGTRLSFVPVPWPDGPAFYLPGLDLVSWPPRWRMHAQAAFVPSYDFANFNTMPALPLILGLIGKSGLTELLSAVILIRAVSLIALLSFAYLLWRWLDTALSSKRKFTWIAAVIGLAALLDPTIRWGTLVVRTEAWICLIWLLIMREIYFMGTQDPGRQKWSSRPENRIGILLAAAASFHFEAVILIPGTVLGLAAGARSLKAWLKRLFKTATTAFLALSPWLIYILFNFNLFLDQMDVQFHRLEIGNHWVANTYLLFHSLFLEMGSPSGLPKFFNIAKFIFWILIAVLTYVTFSERKRILFLAAGLITFYTSFYLWITKPEVWFIAICHMALWTWAAAILITANQNGKKKVTYLLTSLAGGYAFLSFGAGLGQTFSIQKGYSWSNYHEWVSCIEDHLPLRSKVWQPHYPDVLVELATSRPDLDLTRALDFYSRVNFATKNALNSDVVIFTRFFDTQEPVRYRGPERDIDRGLLNDNYEMPFGSWAYAVLSPGFNPKWHREICQVGPFWADLAIKDR